MLAGRAHARATALLADIVESFRALGYDEAERPGPLEARLTRSGGLPLRLRLVEHGRVFGGQVALEISTAEPVLPATPQGLVARPRGAVKLRGLAFRPRGRDSAAEALAARLSEDRELAEALARVHFERVRVEPDGRPVIAHVGGAVVWILFPPLIRPVPFVGEQARATVAALEAFAAVAR